MKTVKIILISLLIVLAFIGCTKKENLKGHSSSDLINLGWSSFRNGNLKNAEKYFEELTLREDEFLIGHAGLGWTYLKRQEFLNARNEFNKFILQNTYAANDTITRDVRTGQTFVHSALSEHAEVLLVSNGFVASNNTNNNYRFRYDTKIDVIDIRLLRAMSLIAMSNFTDAYTIVRLVEPNFEIIDINSIEGRLLLFNKIEELLFDRR